MNAAFVLAVAADTGIAVHADSVEVYTDLTLVVDLKLHLLMYVDQCMAAVVTTKKFVHGS